MQTQYPQLLGLSSTDLNFLAKSKPFLNSNASVLSSASTICSSEPSVESDTTLSESRVIHLNPIKNSSKKNMKFRLSKGFFKIKKAIKSKSKASSELDQKQHIKMLSKLSKSKLDKEYEIFNKMLGDGSNGKVYLVKRIKDQRLFAAKQYILTKSNSAENNLKKIKNEIIINSKMHHLNVVQMLDVATFNNSIYTVVEYCEYDLFDFINNPANKIDENQLVQFYVQLISGVSYIHHQGVAHRDLKLENICVTKNGVLKIIDFGCAVVYSDKLYNTKNNSLVQGVSGSDPYMAPEIWTDEYYDAVKADTFSLGVVFVAMASLKFMWQTTKNSDRKYINYRNTNNKYPYFTKLKLPLCTVPSIMGMLEPDHSKRKTLNELWNEAWVEKIVTKSKLSN